MPHHGRWSAGRLRPLLCIDVSECDSYVLSKISSVVNFDIY